MINAILIDNINDNKIDVTVIMHNLQRQKSERELVQEADYWCDIIPNNQGKRPEKEESETGKKRGTRYDKIAEIMDDIISPRTIQRIQAIKDAEKTAKKEGNQELLQLGLLEKMVTGEITPHNAETLLKNYRKYVREREESKNTEFILPDDLHTKFILHNKSSEIMQEVESESVQTVMTSCPYWDVRTYEHEDKSIMELGHEKKAEAFVDRLMVHLREIHRVLKPRGSFFLNFGEYGIHSHSPLISNMIVLRLHEENLFKCVNEIIWHKTNGKPVPVEKRLMKSYEKIFHLVKDSENYDYYPLKIWREEPIKVMKPFKNRGVYGTRESAPCLQKPYTTFKDFIDNQKYEDVMKSSVANTTIFKKIDPDFDHSAPYDSKICLLGILTTSKISDVILDPFSGTASTGECAMLLGRSYIGYELSERYAIFSRKRIAYTTKGFNSESIDELENLKIA